MKKRLILGLGALALAGSAAFAAPKALPTYADGEETPTSEVSTPLEESAEEAASEALEASSEPVSSEPATSESSLQSGEPGESSSINYLEDKDGDGIPDAIEDYYDQHLRDQYMFGISLGSLIGFAVSFLGWLLTYMRYRKTGKSIEEALALTSSNERETGENFRKMVASSEKLQAKIGDTAEKMEATEKAFEQKAEEYEAKFQAEAEEYKKKMEEAQAKAEETAKRYAEMEAKVKSLREMLVLLSHSEEYVKNGTADEVAKVAKEVKFDGE